MSSFSPFAPQPGYVSQLSPEERSFLKRRLGTTTPPPAQALALLEDPDAPPGLLTMLAQAVSDAMSGKIDGRGWGGPMLMRLVAHPRTEDGDLLVLASADLVTTASRMKARPTLVIEMDRRVVIYLSSHAYVVAQPDSALAGKITVSLAGHLLYEASRCLLGHDEAIGAMGERDDAILAYDRRSATREAMAERWIETVGERLDAMIGMRLPNWALRRVAYRNLETILRTFEGWLTRRPVVDSKRLLADVPVLQQSLFEVLRAARPSDNGILRAGSRSFLFAMHHLTALGVLGLVDLSGHQAVLERRPYAVSPNA